MKDKAKKEKIKKIEKRFSQIHDILVGARNKVISDFKEYGCVYDDFIKNKSEKLEPEKLFLPHLYGFEIIMAPIGYLSSLSKDIDRAPDWLNDFLLSKFVEEETSGYCLKIFDILWKNKFEKLLRGCVYEMIEPFPYGSDWNYDAMAWVFGVAVDAIDLLGAKNDKRKIKLEIALKDFLPIFFEPGKIEFEMGNSKKEKILGYYFSNDKFLALKDNISEEDHIKENDFKIFSENINTRLCFAFSNRSVLAVFDIATDIIKGIERLTESYDESFTTLTSFIAPLVEEIEKYKELKGGNISGREMYYHISNLGILTSLSGYRGATSKFKKLESYCKNTINYFLEQFENIPELQTSLDIFIPVKIPIEDEAKKDVLTQSDFTVITPFPIFIRSIANMLNNSKDLGIEVEKYEEDLENAIDVFLEKYMPEEDGIFMLPNEKGKLQYDLALTASAVEALNLCMGYYLNRWQELGPIKDEEEPSGVWITEEEHEKYKAWEVFKTGLQSEFDDRINTVLKDRIAAIVDEKLKEISPLASHSDVRQQALHFLLESFEKTETVKPKKEKEFQQLWHFLMACTKKQDEIKGDRNNTKNEDIETRKKKAVDQYFNPPADSILKDRLEELDKQVKKIIEKKS